MSESKSKTMTFRVEKETKNAVKFQEEGDLVNIGPLYVQKHALASLGDVKAKTIKVTIELL